MKAWFYKNLRTGTYSQMVDGIVVGHPTEVCLTNVEFRVREGGRQRVIRERRKNVHAFVIGEVVQGREMGGASLTRVRYNPYASSQFTTEAGRPVTSATYAKLTPDGVFVLE